MVRDGYAHNAIFEIDNKQGHMIKYGKFCLIVCNNLNGNFFLKIGHIYMHTTCCTPEAKTLLISDTPI